MKLKSQTTNSIKKIATLLIVSATFTGCETANQAGKDFKNFTAAVNMYNFSEQADPLCQFCSKFQKCKTQICPYKKISQSE
jgi:predicted small secreted protein